MKKYGKNCDTQTFSFLCSEANFRSLFVCFKAIFQKKKKFKEMKYGLFEILDQNNSIGEKNLKKNTSFRVQDYLNEPLLSFYQY